MENEHEEQTTHPWEQLPNEPSKWYSRFCKYISLEPDKRSIHKAIGTTNSSYYKQAAKYQWVERAAAYDQHQILQRLKERQREREINRDKRIAILQAYQDKLHEAINALNPKSMTAMEITAILKQVTDMIRLEYGEEGNTNNTPTNNTIQVVFENENQLSFSDINNADDWQHTLRAPITISLPDIDNTPPDIDVSNLT